MLHQCYLYRGYLQITACDLTSEGTPNLWHILWDPTQPVATRPLAICKDDTWYTYGWDLTKNICEMFGSNGYINTIYTYTPYGEVTSSGSTAHPLQWSSEFNDTELGLVYYNYRYYNSREGRWLGRDFVKDERNTDIYKYLGNNPIGLVDILGLKTKKDEDSEMETKINSTRRAQKMKNLILSHTTGRNPIKGCGSENGKRCSELTVIVEFGNPNSWFPYVGHASMGIDDKFLDFGPNVGKKPNMRFIDVGGIYYDSAGYKKNHQETADVNTKSVKSVINNIGRFSTGFVVAAHICICKNEAEEIEKRMRRLSNGGFYSIPGQQCASTVYAAVYDTSPWAKAALSPQGLMLKYITGLKHGCGPNKGELNYMEFVKDKLTMKNN